MFERYTEKARRVIFFARYEASQFGSPYIETEHLLLGLLREEKCFAAEILHERGLRLSTIREELARSQSEKVTSNRPKESSLLAEFSHQLRTPLTVLATNTDVLLAHPAPTIEILGLIITWKSTCDRWRSASCSEEISVV